MAYALKAAPLLCPCLVLPPGSALTGLGFSLGSRIEFTQLPLILSFVLVNILLKEDTDSNHLIMFRAVNT